MDRHKEEIDIYELWQVLQKYKLIIFGITITITIFSLIYAWKIPSIYQGSVLIEIGDVVINSEPSNDKPTIIQSIDNSNALQAILQANLNQNTISIEMPSGESNLIRLICENENPKIIQQNLQEAVKLVLNRHQEKAIFFHKANALIRPTKVVASISINPYPIKPNRYSIITNGFISGLVIGIFLSFLLEFIVFKNVKKMNSNISEDQ